MLTPVLPRKNSATHRVSEQSLQLSDVMQNHISFFFSSGLNLFCIFDSASHYKIYELCSWVIPNSKIYELCSWLIPEPFPLFLFCSINLFVHNSEYSAPLRCFLPRPMCFHVIIDPYLSIYCPPRLLLFTDDDSSRVETSRYNLLIMELSFVII